MPAEVEAARPPLGSDIRSRMTRKMYEMNMGYQHPTSLHTPSTDNDISPLSNKTVQGNNGKFVTSDPRYMKVCAASFDDFVGYNDNPNNGYIRNSTVVALPSSSANRHGPQIENPLTFQTMRGDGLSRMAVLKGDLLDLMAVKFNAQEIYNEAYNSIKMNGAMHLQRNLISFSRPHTPMDDAYPLHSLNGARKPVNGANMAFLTRLDKQELHNAMTEMANRELQMPAQVPCYDQYNQHPQLKALKDCAVQTQQDSAVQTDAINGNDSAFTESDSFQSNSMSFVSASSERTVNLDIQIPGHNRQGHRSGKHSNRSTPRSRREARQPLDSDTSFSRRSVSLGRNAKHKNPKGAASSREYHDQPLDQTIRSYNEKSSAGVPELPDDSEFTSSRLEQSGGPSGKKSSRYARAQKTQGSDHETKQKYISKDDTLPKPTTRAGHETIPLKSYEGENITHKPPVRGERTTKSDQRPDRRSNIQTANVDLGSGPSSSEERSKSRSRQSSGIPAPIESTKLPTKSRGGAKLGKDHTYDVSNTGKQKRTSKEDLEGPEALRNSDLKSSLRGIRDSTELEYSNGWLNTKLRAEGNQSVKPNKVHKSHPPSRESGSRRHSSDLDYRSTPTFNLSSSLKRANERRNRGLPSMDESGDAYRESIEQSLQHYKTRNLYIDVDVEDTENDDTPSQAGKWNKSIAKKVQQGSNTTVNDSSVASTSEVSLGTIIRKSIHSSVDTEKARGRTVTRRVHRSRSNSRTRTKSDYSDVDSRKTSPGRMSLSDLEPLGSHETLTDGTISKTATSKSGYSRDDTATLQSATDSVTVSRTRNDSAESVCGKCGESLNHPKYHKRYNVYGEMVPCRPKPKSPTSESVSYTHTRSEPTLTNGDVTTCSTEGDGTTTCFDEDKDTFTTDFDSSKTGTTARDLAFSEADLTTAGGASKATPGGNRMSRYGRRETKPSFIIKPRRCFADEGTLGKFRTSFDGEPWPTIEWVRKGVKIDASDKYRIYNESDFHFLEIGNVTKEDRGQYTCVLSNNMGTTRVTAELEVYPPRNQPTSNLKKNSSKSTERLIDAPDSFHKSSKKYAKSSENLASGMSLSVAPPMDIQDRREKTTSRLTVQTNARTDKSPRRSNTGSRSPGPQKSPNTAYKNVKSRISTRRSDSDEIAGGELPATVRVKKSQSPRNVESNNNVIKDERRGHSGERVQRNASPREVRDSSQREVRNTSPREVRNTSPREVRNTSPMEMRNTSPREVRNAAPREVRNTSLRDVRHASSRETTRSVRHGRRHDSPEPEQDDYYDQRPESPDYEMESQHHHHHGKQQHMEAKHHHHGNQQYHHGNQQQQYHGRQQQQHGQQYHDTDRYHNDVESTDSESGYQQHPHHNQQQHQSEARVVTSTRTIQMRNMRGREVDNDDDYEPHHQHETHHETHRNTHSVHINTGSAAAKQQDGDRMDRSKPKVSSVRDKFEHAGEAESKSHSTRINMAPHSTKLSSVRNKFESGASTQSDNKPRTAYGKVDVSKSNLRTGKLAHLSRKFSDLENKDFGPILPKPPPQPGTAFSQVKPGGNQVTSLRIDPRNQPKNTPSTTRSEIHTQVQKSKSHDIPEISVSSAVEFKVQIPQNAQQRKQTKPEVDVEQEADYSQAPPTRHENEAPPEEEPVRQSEKRTKTPPRTSSKPTSKTVIEKTQSLDVPDNSNLRRASSKEKVSSAGSRKSPRGSPVPRKEASPRASPTPKKEASPRESPVPKKEKRILPTPKETSPKNDVSNTSRAKPEKTSPPTKSLPRQALSLPAEEPARAPAVVSRGRATSHDNKSEPALARQRPQRAPPIVVRGLKDLSVDDGEEITLKCTFNGSPSPTVSWYFNNALLKDSDEIQQLFDGELAELKFKDVFPDDTGRYEAIATNRIGQAKTSCILTVKDAKPPMSAPSFTKQLQDTIVCDGDPLTFRAHYTGVPEPQMVWFHDGKEIENCKEFKISYNEGVALLEIEEVYPEDQGLYELIANNEKGETKTVCKLTVNEPGEEVGSILKKFNQKSAVVDDEKPIFIRPLKDVTVHDGDKLTLQVEVTGADPIDICWIHDKEEINPADQNVYQVISNGNQHRLLIADVLPEDQGLWICEAYNCFGDAATQCTLTVKEPRDEKMASGHMTSAEQHMRDDVVDEDVQRDQNILQKRKNKIKNEDANQAPKFIIKPKSKNIQEGDSAKFVCEVVGNPQPQVSWYFDGKLLNNLGRFKITRDGWKHMFEISHALATDAGKYECTANNIEGTSTCSIDLAISKLESPKGGTDFRTILKSRSGMGGVQGNKPQDSGEKEQMDFRGVLTRHVQTKVRPKVLTELRDSKANEGAPLTLTCKISGTPPPTISWYMGKKEIKESKYFHTSYENQIATLEISGVYPEDQGEYLCVAENEAGSAQTKCDVTVLENLVSPGGGAGDQNTSHSTQYIHAMDSEEPPFIEDLQPENVSVLHGNQFKLKAVFVGSPPLDIQWVRGKKDLLKPDERVKIETVRDTTSLIVLRSAPGDSGKYTVSLSNEFGTDSMSASVTVEDKPEAPVGQPVASTIKSTSLTLAWSGPSYDGGTNILDYRVEQCTNGLDDWKTLTSNCKHTSYNITGLESNREYLFRVSAANKHGFGPPSKPSDVIVTVVRHPSALSDLEMIVETDDDDVMLTCPMTPTSFLAANNVMTFTPHEVVVTPGRNFKDYYVLGEEIGKGRFGNVHTCVEKATSQQFAAKFIKVKPSQRNEMKQEINIMNDLHHPKLLLLWDAFESPREMILIMEHVAGGELFERIIDDDYCLTERECVHFMRQICDGIEFMHDRNILHLDLKPENILCITPNSNEVKLIDFGLARKFDPNISTKVLFGTPEFVAPEVINYDQIGYATDMWSLGVICYILVSGLSPFLGDNEPETLANVTMATWDFDDETFDVISEDCKDFMTNLLVKNMRKRMTVRAALEHKWMSQDVKYMRAKRLSTAKHKRFMARRKWQKTGHAIRALGRMASLQKALSMSRQSSNGGSSTASLRSRQSSMASDISMNSAHERSPRSNRASQRIRNDSSDDNLQLNDNETLKHNAHSRGSSTDDTFETLTSSRNRSTATERTKRESDMNSNTLDVDKNNTVNSLTNGYGRSKKIEHQPEPEPHSPQSPEVMSQEEVTSPEVMSESEHDSHEPEMEPPPVDTGYEDAESPEVEVVYDEESADHVGDNEEEAEVDEHESDSGDERVASSDGSPVFTKELKDFKVYEDDSARFDATVTGDPTPDIHWLKEGMPIVVNRRKYMMDYGEGGKCSLIIKFCDADDEATYTCRATNARGKTVSEGHLRVKCFSKRG